MFLESKNYNKTKIKRLLYAFTKERYLSSVKTILLRNIYKDLWNFTIIGGIIGTIAMVIGYITNENVLKLLMVPLGIFLILYFCSKLINRKEFILIACYVFLSITLEEAPELSWIYPIKIMVTTIVASTIAMVVNLYDPRKRRKINIYNEK